MSKYKLKLSATRINTFLQCKLRYWYSYIEKLEKLSNPSFKLGIACHETLELAGQLWKEKGLSKFTNKQIEHFLDVYDKFSVEEGITTYDDHILGRWMVENRLRNFDLGGSILGNEAKFGFPGAQEISTSSGVPLIGAIDKSIEFDEDTLVIIDYKTSRTVPDANKLKTDIQLSMYDLVAKQLYPKYSRIVLGLDMLRTGDIVYTYRTDTERQVFEKYLDAIYAEMSAFKEEDALPNLNDLCGWCDHRNICEKYNKACSQKEFSFLDTATSDIADLMIEWEEVRATSKILKNRESELAGILTEQLKVQEKAVKTADKELVMRQSSRTSYDARKLSKLIPYEDFAKMVTVQPKKLKEYATKNPRIGLELDNISTTNFSAAFLATKKIKKDKKDKK